MIRVKVEGAGEYQIPEDRVNQLVQWLSQNNGVHIMEKNTVREVNDNQFTGRVLLDG